MGHPVRRYKMQNFLRNIALTLFILFIALAAIVYLVAVSTLADPLELFRRYKGEEYLRPYYKRLDVIAAMWALGVTVLYYLGTVLTYFLLQNLMGYKAWDYSIAAGPPESVIGYLLVCLAPAIGFTVLGRGVYMFHYRCAS